MTLIAASRCGRTPDRAEDRRGEDGFTLLELLVVLAIIALLAGLVAPQVLNRLAGAKSSTAGVQIKNIVAALDLYRLDVGTYPSQSDGLDALIRPPPGQGKWHGPYLRSAAGLTDPWGNPYHYRKPGRRNDDFDVFSLGADDAEGGEGEDADVYN